jgi:hypothetical protein
MFRNRSGEQQGDPPAAAASFREGGFPNCGRYEYLKFNQSNLDDGDVKHFLYDFDERNSFTDYEVMANFTGVLTA